MSEKRNEKFKTQNEKQTTESTIEIHKS